MWHPAALANIYSNNIKMPNSVKSFFNIAQQMNLVPFFLSEQYWGAELNKKYYLFDVSLVKFW